MLKISHRDIVLRRGYMRVVRISEDRVRWFIIILPSADHFVLYAPHDRAAQEGSHASISNIGA
jgi:hypothetical protein